jgi:hypothetical protein
VERERERKLRESDEQTIDIHFLFFFWTRQTIQRIINKTAPAVLPVFLLVGWPSALHQPLVPLQQHVGIQKEKSIALLAEKKARK